MKVGDLIKTYYKGYFILDKIERRFVTEDLLVYDTYRKIGLGVEFSPIFYFTQIYDENFKFKNSKQKSCDSQFCMLALSEIEILKERIDNLLKIHENEKR